MCFRPILTHSPLFLLPPSRASPLVFTFAMVIFLIISSQCSNGEKEINDELWHSIVYDKDGGSDTRIYVRQYEELALSYTPFGSATR